MKLPFVTWVGPANDDPEMADRLPAELKDLLAQLNGFIQFHGGLHLRGTCKSPAWHSLRAAWLGKKAFHKLYKSIQPTDVPFAEDCYGNQYLLRNGKVVYLDGETGATDELGLTLKEFLEKSSADPVAVLHLEPLLKFQENGGKLEPGQLLGVMPPFCSRQAAQGVSVGEVEAAERHQFLAELAAFVSKLPPGKRFDFKMK